MVQPRQEWRPKKTKQSIKAHVPILENVANGGMQNKKKDKREENRRTKEVEMDPDSF